MDPLNDKGVFSYLNLLFDVIPDLHHSINVRLNLTVGAWQLCDVRAGIESSMK